MFWAKMIVQLVVVRYRILRSVVGSRIFLLRSHIVSALALAGLILLALVLPSASSQAAVNSQLNFQGRLLNNAGAVVADGTYNMEFQIWQGGNGCVTGCTSANAAANNGGTLKWTEDWVYGSGSPDNRVTVKNGYFSVTLGSLTSLSAVDFSQSSLWLSMNVGDTSSAATFGAASGDGYMIPFKRLTASPYALQAQNSDALGGLTSGQFVQLAQGVQTDGSTNAAVFLNKTSTGNFVELQKNGADVFTVDNSGNILLGSNADKTIAVATAPASTAGNKLTLQAGTGGSGTGAAGGALVLQGGTAGGTNANGGDVDIFGGTKTGSGSAGNVVLAYNGATTGLVGIGTGSPNYQLDVAGDANLSSGSALRINGTAICTASGCTPAAGSGNYIQNGTSVQTSSNFHVSGSGTADTSFLTPLLDTPSGTTTLNLGTTNATAGINLNQNTTIAAGKSLTVGGAATFQNNANSTSAFIVKTAASGTNQNVLQVDTTNEQVTIGAATLPAAKLTVLATSTPGLIVNQTTTTDIADFTQTALGAGNATVSSGFANVAGIGTSFLSLFKGGDTVLVSTQLRTISSVSSNTLMPATVNWSINATNVPYYRGGPVGTGTVTTAGTTALTGSSTTFTTTFKVGDTILVNGESSPHVITVITDDTHLTVSSAFSTSASSLAYSRAGYDALVIKSNGAVGVGVNNPGAALQVQSTGIGQKTLIAQSGGNQTANVLEVQDSSGNALLSVSPTGATTINPGANNTVGLAVRGGSSGTPNILEVRDSSNVLQDYFDSSGGLFVNKPILATSAVNLGSSVSPFASVWSNGTVNTNTLSAWTGSSLAIVGNGNSTWSTTSGTLTLQSASTLTLTSNTGSASTGSVFLTSGTSTSATAGNVTVDTGATITGTPTVNIGTGNAKAVAVGNSSGTLTLQGNGTSSAVSIQSAASGTISIGTANAANTIQIGNTGNAVAQTINLGNNTTASSTATVTIGSTVGSSATTIQGGTGNLSLLTNSASAKIIAKSSTNSTAAVQIQDSSGNPIANVDTTNQRLGVNTSSPSGVLQVNQGTLAPGTVTNSASSASVTGSSTTFTSTFTPGDSFTITSSGNTCTVLSITSDTALTCTATLAGSSSGSAYTLGNSARLTVLKNGNVGIGTNAPTNPLHVAVNNAGVVTPLTLLQNAGSGDATVEFRNAANSNSFYAGQDASNGGAFTLNSSTAAAGTGINYVQSVTAQNDAGNTNIQQSITLTGAGHLIAVAVSFSGNTTLTCSDGQGNAWTTVDTQYSNVTDNQSWGICYAISSSSGSDLITATFGTTANFRRILINEYTGTATSNVVDTHLSGFTTSNASGTDGVTTSNITTTQAGDLIFGGVDDVSGPTTITAGTNFTSRAGLVGPGGDVMNIEDRTQVSAGTTNATWTFSGSGLDYVWGVVAFKVAPAVVSDTYANSLFSLTQGGTATFRNATNSTSAFVVQNASSINLLQIDSANNRVYVGSSAADSTAILFVPDTSTSNSDPTGVNGAIYYSTGGRGGADNNGASYSGKFRCYEGGIWKNCIGMRDIAERRWGYLSSAGTAPTALTTAGGIVAPSLATSATQAADAQAESIYNKYTSTATSTNAGGIDGPYTQTESRYLPKLVTRIRTDANLTATGGRMWIGLTSASLTSVTVPTTSTANATTILGIGYQKGVDGGNFVCVAGNGTNISGTDTGITAANSTYYDVIIDYSTNGTLVCSIATAGSAYTTVANTSTAPNATSTALGLYEAEILTSGTTARAIDIAFAYLEYN